MKLIRLIVEAYLRKGGGAGWKFCFFSSSTLADIVQNHVTKDIRKEAGGCLVNLLKDKKVQKRPECRALLEQICSEVLFFPDKETRTFLIHFISKNQNLQDALPEHQHTKYLSSAYRTQRLEINKTTISTLNMNCFINHGMFQRQKVAVKILYVKKQHLLEDNPEFQAKERLIREVYNMKQLNASGHPNFPVLLGYDTKSLPYHLITKFEKWGNMLQFVRKAREKNPQVLPSQLLTMLIDVTDALLYLEGSGLVHRAVMAENVLVGEDFVCKLGGLQSLQQIPNGSSSPGSASLNGYHRAECPPLDDDYLPRRWKAPECLSDHQYSTASDVWALGVLIYEVLTYGCTPYRHIEKDVEVDLFVVNRQEIVPMEECFETQEYELIKQCCEIESQRRLQLSEVKIKLNEIVNCAGFNKERRDPPPLEINQNSVTSDPARVLQNFVDLSRPGPVLPEMQQNSALQNEDDVDIYSRIPGDFHQARPNPPSLGLLPPPPPLPPRPPRPPLPPRTLFQSSAVQNEENVDTYSIISDDEEVIRDLVKKKVQDETEIWEKLWQEDDKHVRGLIGLNNPNLATFLKAVEVDSHYWIFSPASPSGNLKEYVLDRKCKLGHIVTYLSQVASALHYLHVNHIVHGDLRAEYVNVVAQDKVQVGRMGRSKSLTMSIYEVTSTSSVVQANMPRDAIRWSAPEVVSDGLYTHASDVWSLGILAWELYTSFTAGQAQRDSSVPYYDLNDHEILPYMRRKGPLDRPENCPDWIHIIMHQCWTFDSAQRPPSLAIVDCLTSRKPMMSWIMQLWLGKHDRSEWPDLDICQPEDACHVTDAKMHPSKLNMEKMCSEDFFEKHSYRYIDIEEKLFPRKKSKEDDAVDDANCKIRQNGTTHNEDYEGNDVPSSFDQDNCGKYDKPAEANNPQESKHLAECLNVVQEIDDPYCSLYDMPVSNNPKARDNCAMHGVIPKPKRQNEQYQNKANQMDEDDCSKYDKRATNTSKGQTKAHNMNQDAYTIDEEPTAKFPQDKGGNDEEYQNKTGNKQNKDCPIDNKPVACISEEREKNENLQTRARKLYQGVCPMYGKPAANSPEDREGNGEYRNAVAFRKALSFWTSQEDKDQTRNAPLVRDRREIKSSKSLKEDNDGDVVKRKICQNGQDDHFSGTTHSEDYEDCEGTDVPSSFDQDDCAKYDKPAEANNPQESKHLAECLNVFQQIDDPYCSPVSQTTTAKDNCAMNDKPAAIIRKAKGGNEEYKNKANRMDEKDCSKYDKRLQHISKSGKKNENYQQKVHNMNQDACAIDEEPKPKLPQDKGGNEKYQNKTGNKQKKDCSTDKKPVARISEERQKNENSQTRAPKLHQGVCAMYDKPAANSPEDKDQTRNAPRFRTRREITWQIRGTLTKTQPWRPSSFHEK